MAFETRTQSRVWIEHRLRIPFKRFALSRWKIKWRLELSGSLRIMGEAAPLTGPKHPIQDSAFEVVGGG